ncbi:MAG: hypothetical protein ACI9W2_002752 [Gammaproteobacteria bacterium]
MLVVVAFLVGWGLRAIVMNIKEPEKWAGTASTGADIVDLIFYKWAMLSFFAEKAH